MYSGFVELVRGLDPAQALGRRQEQAVVGADEEAAVAAPQRERAPAGTHSRIDDGQVDAGRHVRERVRQRQRALEHRLRRDPVRDVDDLGVRRDPLHHAVADADEVVGQPEVGQEGDDHGGDPTNRVDQTVEVVRLGLGDDVQSCLPRSRSRLRADRDRRHRGAERGVRPRGRGGGEHDQVGLREALGPQLQRPVERNEVGPELVREQPPRALGAREQHPPCRPRQLSEQALLRRDTRDEVGPAHRLRGRGADRRHPPGLPAHAPAQLVARRSRS